MLACKIGCLGPQRGRLPWATQQVREAGTPHPRKKIETYLGIMGYLWALEWRKK